MKIYVGNLSYETTEQDIREKFETFGQVGSVNIIKDRYSGNSKGFAFVEMSSVSEGQSAITGVNGKTFKDRILVVNVARPQIDNRSRGRGSYGQSRQRRY